MFAGSSRSLEVEGAGKRKSPKKKPAPRSPEEEEPGAQPARQRQAQVVNTAYKLQKNKKAWAALSRI
jgi:hypothetical protein